MPYFPHRFKVEAIPLEGSLFLRKLLHNEDFQVKYLVKKQREL